MIDSLRIETDAFLRAQSTMTYTNWVAGTPSNQDSVYSMHAGLFTREAIERVSRAREEEPDTLQRKRLAYFQRFLTFEYLGRATAPLTDHFATYEGEARMTVGRDTLLYRQLNGLIANEKSQARRAATAALTAPVRRI